VALVVALLKLVDDAAVDVTGILAICTYVVGAVWWSMVSAASSVRLLARLVWIWVPAIAPVALLTKAVNATSVHDEAALAVIVYFPPTAIVILACLLATGAMFLFDNYRRGA
jgi:hypothetical protein